MASFAEAMANAYVSELKNPMNSPLWMMRSRSASVRSSGMYWPRYQWMVPRYNCQALNNANLVGWSVHSNTVAE